MKPIKQGGDRQIPKICLRCGGRLFEKVEDGFQCANCGWLKYILESILDKVKS